MVLNLFDDAVYNAEVSRVSENINGTISITAVTDDSGGYMVMSTTGGKKPWKHLHPCQENVLQNNK